MRPSQLTTLVSGLLHEETQVTERGLDLTVSEVLRVETPGRVDFGGDELDDANLSARRLDSQHFAYCQVEAALGHLGLLVEQAGD